LQWLQHDSGNEVQTIIILYEKVGYIDSVGLIPIDCRFSANLKGIKKKKKYESLRFSRSRYSTMTYILRWCTCPISVSSYLDRKLRGFDVCQLPMRTIKTLLVHWSCDFIIIIRTSRNGVRCNDYFFFLSRRRGCTELHVIFMPTWPTRCTCWHVVIISILIFRNNIRERQWRYCYANIVSLHV